MPVDLGAALADRPDDLLERRDVGVGQTGVTTSARRWLGTWLSEASDTTFQVRPCQRLSLDLDEERRLEGVQVHASCLRSGRSPWRS